MAEELSGADNLRNLPAPTLDPVSCLRIVDSLMKQEAGTAQELSEALDLPIRTVMMVLAHPEFTKRFRMIKREVAKSEFDAVAYDRLITIIQKADAPDEKGRSGHGDKNAIAAAKALSEILGVSERKSVVEHKFSFEDIVHGKARQVAAIPGEVVFPGFDDDTN